MLEAINEVEYCYTENKMTNEASPVNQADPRYTRADSLEPPPNEYDIQVASGAWLVLQDSPNFSIYHPNAEEEKKAVKYSFWKRPIFDIAPDCEAGDIN